MQQRTKTKRLLSFTQCTYLLLIVCWYPIGSVTAESQCPNKLWTTGLFEHGVLFFDKKYGIDQDLAAELQKRTGCKMQIAAIPRARIWHDIKRGQLDISFAGIETPERATFAWFIPYLQMKNLVLLSRSVPSFVTTAEQFKQHKNFMFGAVRSYKHGRFHDDFLQQLDLNQRVSYYPDAFALFEALKKDRVQAIFSQPPVYRYLLAKTHFDYSPTIIDWSPKEQSIPHCLVLSKLSFDETSYKNWKKIIADIQNDGTLLNIFNTYLTSKESQNLMLKMP